MDLSQQVSELRLEGERRREEITSFEGQLKA